MKCPSDGLLRGKIDGELNGRELLEVDSHLSSCQRCRQRVKAMAAEVQRISKALSTLEPAGGYEKSPQAAFVRFQAKYEDAQLPRGFGKWFTGLFSAHPFPAWGGAALAALIVALVVFAPARSLGQRILSMLRVERVAVVPVSLSSMPGRSTMETVSRILSDQVTVTLKPGKPQMATSASQASQLAGFQVRTLAGQSEAPQISVEGERAFNMTLSQQRLEEAMSALGRSDLQIPASVDGSTIAVHIPKAVAVEYGDCPRHGSQNGPPQPSPANTAGCTAIVEVPSPVVSVPPSLDINQLAEVALQAAGMTAEEAEAFCQTVDWSSTLVVPIPSGATSSMRVAVDGVEGTLITGTRHNGGPARYDLIWVKNGIIYSIWGSGSAENALGVAGSLS